MIDTAGGRRGAVLVLVLLVPTLAQAQHPHVTRFSVGEGLPSATVIGLAQERSGRLFMLCRGRVVAYDGQAFETHGTGQGLGLSTPSLTKLAADRSGQVFAAAHSGPALFRWRGRAWESLPPPRPSGQRPWLTTALAATGIGEVVVGTGAQGLFRFDGAAWSQVDVAEGLPSSEVQTLAAYGKDVAVGTPSGLCRLSGGRVDCAWHDDDPRLAEPILALADVGSESAPRLAVLTRTWVGTLDDAGLTVRAEGINLQVDPAPVLATVGIDRMGALYYGTARSLFVLGPGDKRPQRLGPPQGLVGEGAMALLSDREGGFWIAGYRGLSRIGSWRFVSLDARDGLAQDEVSALAEPAPGRVVAGHNGAVSFIDDGHATAFRFGDGQGRALNRVLGFAVDRHGNVWGAAQDLGLIEIGLNRRVTFHHPLAGVRAVAVDARDRLWVAGWRDLRVRIGSRFEPAGPTHAASLPLNLRTLTAGRGGRLYLGTHAGLLWREGLDAERVDLLAPWQLATAAAAEASDVYAVLDDPSGTVWVGTTSGLYLLSGSQLAPATGALALSRPVYFLRKDHSDRLWAGTDDGVFVSGPLGFRHLTTQHGLAGRETNRGTGIVDAHGDVWIGTDQGLSVYRQQYELGPAVPPRVEIRSLETPVERHAPDTAIELRSDQGTITVHAAPVTLASEETVLCRYRLDGFDTDWQGPAPLTASGLRYTNLPPGRYRFRIAAGWDAGGPWGEEAQTAEISLARPLLRGPWFLGSLALFAGLVLAAGHTLRLRQSRHHNAQLASLNDKLEDLLATRERLVGELEQRNKELERFAYTVSHDLKAPLITIRSFAGFLEKDAEAGDPARLRLDVDRIKLAAARMLRLLEDLLELARAGRALGSVAPVAMSEAAREAADQLPDLGRAELVIAPELPVVTGDRARLVAVLQNLLENAAKFSAVGKRPRIEVGARDERGTTVYFVADNGVGIEPRFQEAIFGLFERLDPEAEGTGVGLAIVRRVVELHGGRVWVESEGAGLGARFCFTLPGPAARS
jgi:signal transduction histidine kinase/ligand-binding sensor domain-containing protein